MPLRLPDRLPAIDLLKQENIFVMDDTRAHSQDIRPLKIVILNLMPLKITTETDLIRLLSNTPLQLDINFKKEGLFGEKIKVHTQMEGDTSLHSIQAVDDQRELARVRFSWR